MPDSDSGEDVEISSEFDFKTFFDLNQVQKFLDPYIKPRPQDLKHLFCNGRHYKKKCVGYSTDATKEEEKMKTTQKKNKNDLK